ncbi:MAG: alpha-galactosidase, partial [Pseudomonadota bacterium]
VENGRIRRAELEERVEGVVANARRPISLHPELGRGFMGHPALIAHRPTAMGSGWAGLFKLSHVHNLDDGVQFACHDSDRGLDLLITIRLCPETDVATFSARLSNISEGPIIVDWFSAPALSVPQELSEHMSFHGRWTAEFEIDRKPVPLGLSKRENRRGRTSHEAFPGTILLAPTTDQETGSCLGVHMGWSGNHRMLLERMATGDTQLQMGILMFSGEGTLEPGTYIETPEIYVAHSSQGLNDLSQKIHAYVRKHILDFPDKAKPRPVTVNTWEALYFDHDHDRLTALVDAAADIGAERFVLDDGWFIGRDDDTTSLGDWYADPKKYPDGLEPLASYVREKGLEFGLWVEPEMVNPSSELYRKHPDWALGLGNYPVLLGRNQLVLDLTNPAVTDYLFERLDTLVREHQVSYLKWDMNRDLVLPGDSSGKAAVHRQTLALYALLDRLGESHKDLEIESCASGGGRVDYEILKRTHRFWTSDSNDAVERVRIQNGFSYFFPPEVMGAHIGPAWCHTTGRGFHADYRALVSSYGHMGVEADLTKMDDRDRAIIRKAIADHKVDRELWHSGTFHRVRTVDPNLLGALTVAQDHSRARLVLMQIDRPRATVPPVISIPGLDPDRLYRVTLQTINQTVRDANRTFDHPLFHEGFQLRGAELEIVGVGLPSLYAQSGLALSIDAVVDAP